MQAKFPQARFLWIDVEDEADLLYPLDVEDFPALLLAVGDEPRLPAGERQSSIAA